MIRKYHNILFWCVVWEPIIGQLIVVRNFVGCTDNENNTNHILNSQI